MKISPLREFFFFQPENGQFLGYFMWQKPLNGLVSWVSSITSSDFPERQAGFRFMEG
jgi:hypothetical protein